MLEPKQNGGDGSEGQEAAGAFLVAGGQSAVLLEPVVEPLDAVALPIGGAVEAGAAIPRLVGQPRNHGADVVVAQPAPDGPAGIALVGGHRLRSPTAPPAHRAWHRCHRWRLQQRLEDAPVLPLSWRQQEAEGTPMPVGAHMQAGSPPTPTPAQRLG